MFRTFLDHLPDVPPPRPRHIGGIVEPVRLVLILGALIAAVLLATAWICWEVVR